MQYKSHETEYISLKGKQNTFPLHKSFFEKLEFDQFF